jgi:HEAT repeat protein
MRHLILTGLCLCVVGCGNVELLTNQLKDPDAQQRAKAARKLGKMGRKAEPAVPALIDTLSDDDVNVRVAATWSLGRLGAVSIPPLQDALISDRTLPVRTLCALALGLNGPRASVAVSQLFKAAEDEDAKLRATAAWSLGQTGKQALPVITGAMRSSNANLRIAVAWAIGMIGRDAAREGKPYLLLAVDDQEPRVRERVIWALGQLGATDPAVFAALGKALGDEDERVRLQAARVLEKLSTKRADQIIAQLLDALKNDANAEVRAGAARALGSQRKLPADAVERIGVALQNDAESEVRTAAFWALIRSGRRPAGTLPEFLAALRERDYEWRRLDGVRYDARQVLRRSGKRGTVELSILAKSTDSFKREIAIWALARSPVTAQTLPALNRALEDDEPRVRREAARGLVLMRANIVAGTVPILVQALGDPDPEVSQAAGKALQRLNKIR